MDYKYLENWFNRTLDRSENRGEFLNPLFKTPEGKYDFLVDMHGHTKTYSDGIRSRDYYEKVAKDNGVSFLAVTDHDNIGKPSGLNGVEITCKIDPDNEIEILVYNFDYAKAQELISNGTFPYLDRNFKIARNVSLAKKRVDICNKLNLTDKHLTLGDLLEIHPLDENGKPTTLTLSQIEIDTNDIIKDGEPLPATVNYNGEPQKIDYSFLIGKTFKQIHNSKNGKKFLQAKSEIDPSFDPNSSDHFLKKIISNKNGELYVESSTLWPSAEEVIEFAKQTGGVAILAHPFGYAKKINITTFELLDRANKLGVDGIEACHGFNNPDEIEFLYKYAFNHDMSITIGSDTHGYYSTQGGKTEPGIIPGTSVECMSAGTYNLHYYGSGAWRGEEKFDQDELPKTIENVFAKQKTQIASQKAFDKKIKEDAEKLAALSENAKENG